MAVAAIDADPTGVVLVAELNRLHVKLVRLRDEIGSLNGQHQPAQSEQDEHNYGHAGFGPGVGTLREYLRHVPCTLLA